MRSSVPRPQPPPQALVFTFPVAIKTYLLSFTCIGFDDDGEAPKLRIMAADYSVECVDHSDWSGDHGTVKVIQMCVMMTLSAPDPLPPLV